MKQCIKCKETKPLDEFSFADQITERRKNTCKACTKLYYQQYKNDNPDKLKTKWKQASKKYHTTERRRNKTLRQYGLTEDTYNEMYDEQDGKCYICKEDLTLVIDHCHASNILRKLLCNGCNIGLGAFKDDPELLRSAALYLEMFNVALMEK
jgi:hypothetical protein